MGGRKTIQGKSSDESVIIARKIVCHAQLDPTGEKVLKYMRHVNILRRGVSTSRNRTIWADLKRHGALSSILETLKRIIDSDDLKRCAVVDNGGERKSKNEERREAFRSVDICNVGFSILSNAFALDYAVRSEAMNVGFISSLQKFITNFTSDAYTTFKHSEVIGRAVKCAANLSNDSFCRETVLRNGVAISILKILDFADAKMSESNSNNDSDSVQDAFVDKHEISQLIWSCVRAIRIMSSDSKYVTNDHLIKFGGLITLVNILKWKGNLLSNEDFVLDVVRALTFLSVRIRSAPFDVIQTLIYNSEESKMRSLVRLFENCQPNNKLYSSVISCLINFSSNKEVSDCLGGLRIFQIILSKFSDLDEEQHYIDLIKLLTALTRYSSFNQTHLATSPLIGSTLKILKSTRYKDYHEWLLLVYEKLYEVSLSKLVQSGLVTHLCDLLREEIEDCDYESLRKKISTLEDSRCSVHNENELCPFAPQYRCSSPTYMQIQEEMKSRAENEICIPFSSKKGEDSLSPFSSPAHSSTSGSVSPVHSDFSNASYSTMSEDEGCFSPGSNTVNDNGERSPLIDIGGSDIEMEDQPEEVLSPEANEVDMQQPPSKKVKLETSPSLMSNSTPTSLALQSNGEKSLESLKSSVIKIVSVLNILYKCTHIKPFPKSIAQIIPILSGILIRGQVSLMPQGVQYQTVPKDNELLDLSRRTFDVAYKILLQMGSAIQIFPEIIMSGFIPVLYRLQQPFSSNLKNPEQVVIVQNYCENLMDRMVGFKNDTAGWREGYIMRSAIVNSAGIPQENVDQMILNIPLLYEKHVSILRKFERNASSVSRILDMLKNSDDAHFYRFEDCALALCSICKALGVKWKAPAAKLPVLFDTPANCIDRTVLIYPNIENPDSYSDDNDDIERVKLILDDGTIFSVRKDLLVEASPVFSAMFNGHFIETDQQKVHLTNVSKDSVLLLINQISILSEGRDDADRGTYGENIDKSCQFNLSAIFQLFTLADRFLLQEIYERALNTLLIKYLCPYSAPMLYAESVKLSNLQRSGCSQQLGDSDFNLLILKYILTAENVRMSERCNAIRKVFDSVVPSHVVQDLQTLIDNHMYKNS